MSNLEGGVDTLDPATTTLEPREVAQRLAAEGGGPGATARVAAAGTTITLSLANNDGYIQLNWNNSGAVGRWDYVALYDTQPTDPDGYLTRQWTYVRSPSGNYTTGTGARGVAGPSYWIAYISYDYTAGAYKIVQTAGPSQP